MWRYGYKLIRHLFEKRTEGQSLRVVLESKIQADSDRSDIRMFETRLSPERYGDYEQGTGNAAYENESARLISIAKDNGLYVTKTQIYRSDYWNSTKNIHILYPDVSYNKKNKAPKNNINNASVLYQICFGENSMLFT